MFDVFKGRMTAHGEAWIQYLGRLATIVSRLMLKQMERTPPTLWTSSACKECVDVWFSMLPQYISALATRTGNETNDQAVARCINESPDSYRALHTAMTQDVQPLLPAKRGCQDNKLPLTRLRGHDSSLATGVARNVGAGHQFQFPLPTTQQAIIGSALSRINTISAPPLAPASGSNYSSRVVGDLCADQ